MRPAKEPTTVQSQNEITDGYTDTKAQPAVNNIQSLAEYFQQFGV